MIERNNEVDYDLICDICGNKEDGFYDFNEAVEYKKENSWKSEKYRANGRIFARMSGGVEMRYQGDRDD